MEKLTILIAESDNNNFAELLNGFDSLPVRHHVQRVKSGKQLLEFLSGLVIYKLKLPNLVLLELSTPETSTFETLELIKVNSYISNIPIIIYTSSVDSALEKKCLASGACSTWKAQSPYELNSVAIMVQDFMNMRLTVTNN